MKLDFLFRGCHKLAFLFRFSLFVSKINLEYTVPGNWVIQESENIYNCLNALCTVEILEYSIVRNPVKITDKENKLNSFLTFS